MFSYKSLVPHFNSINYFRWLCYPTMTAQVITVMEWESKETRAAFIRHMVEYHPEKSTEHIVNEVDQWVNRSVGAQMINKLRS